MKIISYALFGFNQQFPNSFDFNSYLRGLAINIRFNRLLFPDWKILLQTDEETYKHYSELFNNWGIMVQVNPPAPLCLAMLWRMKPVFNIKYTHVLCRDLDSVATLREAQCVEEWVQSQKVAHAITDSISHNVPMMGGMVGFTPGFFMEHTNINTWEQLIQLGSFDWSRKGTDQELLNRCVYPKVAQPGNDNIMQHYLLGMPNTFLSGYRSQVPQILPDDMAESNSCAGHIGAAGFYPPPTFAFLRKYKDSFNDLIEAERSYPHLFFWLNDGTFD